MGEDLASLIADEADTEHMAENYRRCVAAYYKGFSRYADISCVTDNCVWEMILILFGYRIVERHINSDTPEEKSLQIRILEEICHMKHGG